MDDIRTSVPTNSLRFIDRLRIDMRDKGYAYQTEKTYVHWVKRYIYFHNKQNPASMDAVHINQFLSSLGNDRHCSPATQRIALNALIYLYRKFLQVELEPLDFEKSRLKRRLPVVLTHIKVKRLLEHVSGKGGKDRVTLLPESLKERLQLQIEEVSRLHRQDLLDGYGEVYMPDALSRKYPSAAKELGWQFLFPATSIGRDPRSGVLLGHSDVRTTEIYTHVLGRGAMGVISPVDG